MSVSFDFLTEPRRLHFVDHNSQGAIDALRPSLEKRGLELVERFAAGQLGGIILRAMKRYAEAYEIYRDIGDDYQAGYCLLLLGQTEALKPHWARVVAQRQNHWCVTLFGMIHHQVSCYPTLLQIRNYLEADVFNLLEAGQTAMLENILIYADFMGQINLETHKFIGRGFLNHGSLEQARTYLYQAQKALPNDPETYFYLGLYYHSQEAVKESRLMLNQCLLISPTYTPAKDLLAQLSA